MFLLSKKMFFILLCIMGLGLFGCGSQDSANRKSEESPKSKKHPPKKETPKPKTPKPNNQNQQNHQQQQLPQPQQPQNKPLQPNPNLNPNTGPGPQFIPKPKQVRIIDPKHNQKYPLSFECNTKEWDFPSDHIPLGAMVSVNNGPLKIDFGVATFNVLNKSAMGNNLEKNVLSQNFNGKKLEKLLLSERDHNSLERQDLVVEVILDLLNNKNIQILALQEVDQHLLLRLQNNLSKKHEILSVQNPKNNNDYGVIVFDKKIFKLDKILPPQPYQTQNGQKSKYIQHIVLHHKDSKQSVHFINSHVEFQMGLTLQNYVEKNIGKGEMGLIVGDFNAKPNAIKPQNTTVINYGSIPFTHQSNGGRLEKYDQIFYAGPMQVTVSQQTAGLCKY